MNEELHDEVKKAAQAYSTIPLEIVALTRKRYEKDRFVYFLKREYGETIANSIIKQFGISCAQKGTLLWYEDGDHKFRTGQIMSIDFTNGVVEQEEHELVHEIFAQRHGVVFNYVGCCFGDHQYLESCFRPKGMVADPLLAIVLSILIKDIFWYAPPVRTEFDIRSYVNQFADSQFFLFPNEKLLPSWNETLKGCDPNFIILSDQLLTLYPQIKTTGLLKNSNHMQTVVTRIKSVIADSQK